MKDELTSTALKRDNVRDRARERDEVTVAHQRRLERAAVCRLVHVPELLFVEPIVLQEHNVELRLDRLQEPQSVPADRLRLGLRCLALHANNSCLTSLTNVRACFFTCVAVGIADFELPGETGCAAGTAGGCDAATVGFSARALAIASNGSPM